MEQNQSIGLELAIAENSYVSSDDSDTPTTHAGHTSKVNHDFPAPVGDMIAPNDQPWGGTYYSIYLLKCTTSNYNKVYSPPNFMMECPQNTFTINVNELNIHLCHNGFLMVETKIHIMAAGNDFLIRDAVRGLKFFWEQAFNTEGNFEIMKLITAITEMFSKSVKKLDLLYPAYQDYFAKHFNKFKNKPVWAHPVYQIQDHGTAENNLYSIIKSTSISTEKENDKPDSEGNSIFGLIGSPYSCLFKSSTGNKNQDYWHAQRNRASLAVIMDTCLFDAALEHVHRMHYTYAEEVYHCSEDSNVPELQKLSEGIVALIQMSSQIEAQISQYSRSLSPEATPAWTAIKAHWGIEPIRNENRSKLAELERLLNRNMNLATQRQQRLQNQVIVFFSVLSLISLILAFIWVSSDKAFKWPIANYAWLWIIVLITFIGSIIALFWGKLFPHIRKDFPFRSQKQKKRKYLFQKLRSLRIK